MSFAHLPCQQQVTQHGHHINHSDFGDSVSLINFKKENKNIGYLRLLSRCQKARMHIQASVFQNITLFKNVHHKKEICVEHTTETETEVIFLPAQNTPNAKILRQACDTQTKNKWNSLLS
jgi:hypothetical protein